MVAVWARKSRVGLRVPPGRQHHRLCLVSDAALVCPAGPPSARGTRSWETTRLKCDPRSERVLPPPAHGGLTPPRPLSLEGLGPLPAPKGQTAAHCFPGPPVSPDVLVVHFLRLKVLLCASLTEVGVFWIPPLTLPQC